MVVYPSQTDNDSTMAAQLRTSTGQVTASATDNEQIKQTWNAWRNDKTFFQRIFTDHATVKTVGYSLQWAYYTSQGYVKRLCTRRHSIHATVLFEDQHIAIVVTYVCHMTLHDVEVPLSYMRCKNGNDWLRQRNHIYCLGPSKYSMPTHFTYTVVILSLYWSHQFCPVETRYPSVILPLFIS